MAKPKRASTVRSIEEFARLVSVVKDRPHGRVPVYSWTLERIKDARDAQLRGDFREAARLAESSKTDDAIFVAFQNRLAPHRAISVKVTPKDDSRKAALIAEEADALFGPKGIGLTPETMLNVGGALVDHGLAILRVSKQPREDGSRVDLFANYWPIEHVRWDEHRRCLLTGAHNATGGYVADVEIRHGDGEWIVIADREHEPWKHGAILSTALIWGRHAFANADWARGSRSHGNAKVVGELPANMPLQDETGALSKEAVAFLALLRDLASEDSPVGIRPAGAKTDVVANGSSAWQVWKELAADAAKGAARIYLGTDGVLGAAGGAPGVDIAALFGVAATLVQGDLETIERCLKTGLLDVWTAINFGDSSLAPTREYMIPRSENQSKVLALAEREKAFFAAISAAKSAGFTVDQAWVNEAAKRYDVPAPVMPAAAEKAPTVPLAPTDIIEYLTPNQVLATVGLPPDAADPDGDTKIRVLRAREEAAAAAASNGGGPPATPQ